MIHAEPVIDVEETDSAPDDDVVGDEGRLDDSIKTMPRRSTRSTKGQHSTREHLLKSAMSGTTAEAMVNTLAHQHAPPTFEDMGRAMAALGASLGQILQDS